MRGLSPRLGGGQFPLPLGPDRLLPAGQLVRGRDVTDCALEPNRGEAEGRNPTRITRPNYHHENAMGPPTVSTKDSHFDKTVLSNLIQHTPTGRSNTVTSFLAKHRTHIKGILECFDRLIIRGHLPMAGVGYFSTWLYSKHICLNLQQPPQGWSTFKEAAPSFAAKLKAHAQELAAREHRMYKHLSSHERMEESARAMAERDGIQDGLVCVYGAMETCRTFRVRYEERCPTVGSDMRVCLVLYYYWMDREFGLMHVKIQTWCPFTVQVYVNGHEWLARKLTAQGIGFRKVDNAFVELDDAKRAGECARGFWRRAWPKLLNCLAQRINPLMKDWLAGQNYYWVIDQAEFSTDVMFAEKKALATLRPALYEHALLCFGAEKLMTFLGRKYRETFQGEVRTQWHRREPGGAVKHWIKANAVKMYDKDGTVLRIETVINNPREFFVHRPRLKQDGTKEVGWYPMSKGVVNLYRYAEVCQRANCNYLEALAVVNDLGVGQGELDRRCAPVYFQGRTRRGLQPLGCDDQALFKAALRGEHAVRGFRNGELAERLYGPNPQDPAERRRRCGRVSRRISLLRAHGLVAKVPRSRRYRVTGSGQRFMSTAMHVRAKLFPRELTGLK
jgi:hypothetical protein